MMHGLDIYGCLKKKEILNLQEKFMKEQLQISLLQKKNVTGDDISIFGFIMQFSKN